MKIFCNWIFQNKEWLFSGLGLALVITLGNILRWLLKKYLNSKKDNPQQACHMQKKTKPELKRDINHLFEENRIIFEEYGPHRSEAYMPLHDAAIQWNRRVRDTIIPNNDKILFYLNEYRSLLNSDEAAAVQKFSVHAEAFKHNHTSGEKNSSAPLFPKEILSILGDD